METSDIVFLVFMAIMGFTGLIVTLVVCVDMLKSVGKSLKNRR